MYDGFMNDDYDSFEKFRRGSKGDNARNPRPKKDVAYKSARRQKERAKQAAIENLKEDIFEEEF